VPEDQGDVEVSGTQHLNALDRVGIDEVQLDSRVRPFDEAIARTAGRSSSLANLLRASRVLIVRDFSLGFSEVRVTSIMTVSVESTSEAYECVRELYRLYTVPAPNRTWSHESQETSHS
jgi:hypothetical protein